jgi:hypothetical protein
MRDKTHFRPHPARLEKHSIDAKHYGCPIADGPLDREIRAASSVMTWNSKAVLEAIRLDVPFVIAGPNSIAKDYKRAEREQFLYNIAYAQWTEDELSTGIPFRRLLCG